MSWFSRKPELPLSPPPDYAGKYVVAWVTTEMKEVNRGSFGIFPSVAKRASVTGMVTKHGAKTICIEGTWYSLDKYEPGGLDIEEVFDKAPEAKP